MTRHLSRGFTLIELLVVVAIIGILAASVGNGVSRAMKRAKISRATAEVREMTNAILAYENYDRNHSLQNFVCSDADASRSTLAFIIGEGGNSASGEKIPVLYNAAMTGNQFLDPWRKPYRVSIQPASGLSSADTVDKTAASMTTSLFIPNFTRLSEGERH